MYGVMLVIILIITGGAIAFIGDRLGTKVGKKKLSLFGLRPKHTSIIVTIITGIMITTITFTILSAASENVRLALFGMEKIQRQMKNTKLELDDKIIELNKSKEDLEKVNKEYEASNSQLNDLEHKLSIAKENTKVLQKVRYALIKQNNELLTYNNSLKSISEKLEADNKNLEASNQKLIQGIETIREHPIVYRVGELLASGVINNAADIKEADKQINGIISLANSRIIERLGTDTKSSIYIYPDNYQKAINHILENKNGTVIRLIVAANMVNGDPVFADLETFPYKIIYLPNQLVYEGQYNLDENTASDIIIGDFLRKVNQAAVKKGLLPNPLTGTVGAISGVQIMELEDILSNAKGTTYIKAYAATNTSIIDPLKLNITVSK